MTGHSEIRKSSNPLIVNFKTGSHERHVSLSGSRLPLSTTITEPSLPVIDSRTISEITFRQSHSHQAFQETAT